MKYLLDTHIILWYLEGNEKLSEKAIEIIEDEKNEIFYSVASLWEVTIKHRKRRESFPYLSAEILHYAEQCGFHRVNIRDLNVLAYEDLPDFHTDPFDCMLVAQAKSEGMVLMTHDSKLEPFGSEVLIV